ncbi:MAG TPA: hypothetical protein PLA35_03560 [Caldisericia bacterium]|nr:hypothetical protein [Caldisericia bacterium]
MIKFNIGMDIVDIKNVFEYEKGFKDIEIKKEKIRNYEYKKIKFRSSITSKYEENNFVYGYIFYPNKEYDKKNILAIHPVHEAVPFFEHTVAFYFLKYGYRVSYITLPFHRERMPKDVKSKELFLSNDEYEYFFSMRQSIVDLRHFIQFLNDEEDDKEIYSIGFSLGAILLNLLMGVDNRIIKGVSLMGAGNVIRLMGEGMYGLSSRRYYKKQGLNYDTYRNELKNFLNYVDMVKSKGELIETKTIWYLVDPLTYASFNNPRNVLFINGLFDLVMIKKAVYDLWERLGKPKIIWIPSSHYASPLFFPYILNQSKKFFEDKI